MRRHCNVTLYFTLPVLLYIENTADSSYRKSASVGTSCDTFSTQRHYEGDILYIAH